MFRLNAAFRADMEWWHVFVQLWNGVSLLRDYDSHTRSAALVGCFWWVGLWYLVGIEMVSSGVEQAASLNLQGSP